MSIVEFIYAFYKVNFALEWHIARYYINMVYIFVKICFRWEVGISFSKIENLINIPFAKVLQKFLVVVRNNSVDLNRKDNI